MKRFCILGYGIVCYLGFLASFLYLLGFLSNQWVPRSIDQGVEGGATRSFVVNILILAVFALQHSVMARPGFKRWVTRVIPASIERSTYVLASNLALVLLFVAWMPMTESVWHVEAPLVRGGLWCAFAFGFAVVLYSTFLISHFDLGGLRQVMLAFRRRTYEPTPFVTPSLYRWVRHPLYCGWTIAFWATPDMSAGHLLFAIVMTGYMACATLLEERDLVRLYGQRYEEYRSKTPAFVPRSGRVAGRCSSDQ